MHTRVPRRIGLLLASTVLVAACGSGTLPEDATPAPTTSEAAVSMTAIAEPDDAPSDPAPAPVTDDAAMAHARDRCLTAIPVMERRIEVEGWPYEDEEEELSDEELERTLAPEIDFTDGVAGADERPTITPMGVFEVETVDLVQLDHFVESCFEHGIVTEEEIWGDEGEDEDEGAGEEDEDD